MFDTVLSQMFTRTLQCISENPHVFPVADLGITERGFQDFVREVSGEKYLTMPTPGRCVIRIGCS